MPKRSNIFQRLVAALHAQIGPGWTVTESTMLQDGRTDALREVDVAAQANVGGYPLIISIEVRDRKRRAGVTWVEEMAQKHADLPTSKLALWSSSGFTEEAVKKARSLGIDLVAPAGIDAAPWATIARELIGGTAKLVQPRFGAAVDVRLSDAEMARWEAPSEMVLRAREGDAILSIGGLLRQVGDNPETRSIMLDHAPEGSGSFLAIYTPPFPCLVQGPAGEVGAVDRVVISIETVCDVADVVDRTAVHNQVATTLFEASLSDGTLELVVAEPESGKAEIKSRLIRDSYGISL